MNNKNSGYLKKISQIIIVLAIWSLTVWLFFPLFIMDAIQIANDKLYLFRAALGIAIMLIMFGKTIFDLFFPQSTSNVRTALNTIFLAVYSFIIAGGIIFMVARLIILYIRSIGSGSTYF